MSDFISNLPGNLIEQILVYLTLKEAARTSVLSKRWRYKWISIPQLVFESSTFSSSEHSQDTSNEFPPFIHQVLSQHEGSLSKFNLSIPRLCSCPEIDHSISFLSRKSIEEFILCIQEENPHKIPLNLFSCRQLRLLCLQKCVLEPPPDFAGFAKLTNLNFTGVDLPARFSETFVAKCPLLECLTLHKCTNLDGISFYAPNLKLLDYIGCIGFISFKNTPGLKKVSLGYFVKIYQRSSRGISWIESFCSLPSLEYLHLRERFFSAAMRLGTIPNSLASKFNCLVTVVLSGLNIVHGHSAMSIFCLLKCSPNLEKLQIQFYENKPSVYELVAVTLFSKGINCTDFFLGKLRAVELSALNGLTAEMSLSSFCLPSRRFLRQCIFITSMGAAQTKPSALYKRLTNGGACHQEQKSFFLESDES